MEEETTLNLDRQVFDRGVCAGAQQVSSKSNAESMQDRTRVRRMARSRWQKAAEQRSGTKRV